MTATVWTNSTNISSVAGRALKAAAQLWFLVAVAGQWIFALYVAAFYGGAAIDGNLAAWNRVMPRAYVQGETAGNVAIGAHLLLAVLIMIGGPLQLIPKLRGIAPRFHRWNGRVYLTAVVLTSLAGLYMVWFRGAGNEHLVQHVGITGDAVLILLFAGLALRFAVARDLGTHRRWALRLFIVVSGVWFFRVGLMFWVAVNQGPAGFDPKTFTGPFLSFWAFGDYLLPLAVLEAYLYAKDRGGAYGRLAVAGALFILTIAMAIGIVVASMGMWLPHI